MSRKLLAAVFVLGLGLGVQAGIALDRGFHNRSAASVGDVTHRVPELNTDNNTARVLLHYPRQDGSKKIFTFNVKRLLRDTPDPAKNDVQWYLSVYDVNGGKLNLELHPTGGLPSDAVKPWKEDDE